MTLIEALVTLSIGAVLMLSLSTVLSASLDREANASRAIANAESARFALDRIERHIRTTTAVFHPDTSSIADTLVIAQDPTLDSNNDGIPDADNDQDGRVNEDPGADLLADNASGIAGIDDDGDGEVDETSAGGISNDDEDEEANEDPVNRVDDDGDGRIDEDPDADHNGDGCAGICGVDDDGDGTVDEGASEDDDEDGRSNEDWIDVVIYRLIDGDLIEFWPVSGATNGNSFTSVSLMNGVERFSVVRTLHRDGREELELELTTAGDDLQSSVFRRKILRRLQ